MARSLVLVLVALFVVGAFAGCVGGEKGVPSVSPEARAKRGAPVINLNQSLFETAAYAVDERFGPDRPLTLKDIPDLLPKVITNYNVTMHYVLNMSLYPNIKAYQIGESLLGRAIFGLVLTNDGQFHPDRPSVMFTCTQHGNEPSGSEACLIFIEYFTFGTDDFANTVRNKLNILINPLANPDGKEANTRGNLEQTDINRDHMNLVTTEARAIHKFYNMFNPEFCLDLHEFGGSGVPPPASGPVTTWNTFQIGMPHGLAEDDKNLYAANAELWGAVFQAMSQKYGYGSTRYYEGSTSAGSDPSVHRHHFALRNSFSLLFETGAGTGNVNLPLRTDSHITASFAVINYLLANQATVVGLVRSADQAASQKQPGIQGWLIPPQANTEKARSFLSLHGVNYTVLSKDTAYATVQSYAAGASSVPASKTFGNGTLVVNHWVPDGHLINQLFENTDDTYYVKGPRSWPLDVYRILSAN